MLPGDAGKNRSRYDKQQRARGKYEADYTSYPMSQPNPFRDPLSDIPQMAAS